VNKNIQHKATVVDNSSKKLKLKIDSMSACASCHAKSACTAADSKEKYIEVYTDKSFPVGSQVIVEGKSSLSIKATMYAYGMPIIILIVGLFVYTAFDFSEAMSGILSIVSLLPYYIFLKLYNRKLEKTFTFNIVGT
jgi:sigma-E factor negative regulatory protein RseC